MSQNPEVIVKTIVLAASLLAIVFGFGVVWRVEKKLDVSFKLFLLAIIFFFAGEVLNLFYIPKNNFIIYAEPTAKILFAAFFLAGMITMRNMIRKIDGET
ncbi:MAG: hypothetical protein QMD77_01900 [Patescibacteria group bacterium]|nr:hypothetical protein [Patescibacteria group bacterium]